MASSQTDRWRTTLRAAPIALKPSLEGSWALLCGCVAAGLLNQQADVLRIVAIWFVADIALGGVLEQLLALRQATLPEQGLGQDDAAPHAALTLPYATPGSLGYRLITRVNAYLSHWRDQVWPDAGQHAMTALVCAGLALLLSTYLGREIAGAVSVALLAVACLAVLAGGRGAALERWYSGLHVGLAWALGHLAFGPWQAPSLGLALMVGLGAYARCLRRQSQWRRGGWVQWVVWWALVAVLLVARQPALAGIVAVAAWGGYIASGQESEEQPGWPARLEKLGWIVTQGVAAVAVTYWA